MARGPRLLDLVEQQADRLSAEFRGRLHDRRHGAPQQIGEHEIVEPDDHHVVRLGEIADREAEREWARCVLKLRASALGR
jgi:hypothetical protein